MLYYVFVVAFFWAVATAQNIPANSFANFDTYWNYLYPWGSDHNGGARMDAAHVSVEDGVLVLTAEPVTGQSPAQHGGSEIPINYFSGAIHAKEQFTVKAGGGYDFSADFIAPVEVGTWPAFWLTGVNSWPPEIDIAEWKGSGDISFNTFNTSSEVDALDVDYPSPSEWHSVKAEIRAVNGQDLKTDFYLDGEWVTSQYGANFINAPFWFIINYQMEGSSGEPGPEDNSTFSVGNTRVVDYNP